MELYLSGLKNKEGQKEICHPELHTALKKKSRNSRQENKKKPRSWRRKEENSARSGYNYSMLGWNKLYLRLVQTWSKRSNLCCFVLFLDVPDLYKLGLIATGLKTSTVFSVKDRRGHHKVKLREIPVSRTQKSHWAKPSGSKSNTSESM